MTANHAHTLRLALAVSLGGFVFGFDASVISGAVRFVAQDFALGDLELGLLVGAPTLGGILSASCAGPLSDLYGRRTLLLVLAGAVRRHTRPALALTATRRSYAIC